MPDFSKQLPHGHASGGDSPVLTGNTDITPPPTETAGVGYSPVKAGLTGRNDKDHDDSF